MSNKTNTVSKSIMFGENWLSIEDINEISLCGAEVLLNPSPQYHEKIARGPRFLEKVMQEDGVIYGVTTGYGDSCSRLVPLHLVNELPLHLTRFHGCGLGKYFSHQQARAIMAVRLCSLAKGVSGVSLELLQQIILFLNHQLSPLIPEEGSVGASGDLTPLSYLAAALIGERALTYQGQALSSQLAMDLVGIKPIQLKPKEGLAIMNGTAVMTALACEAYQRATYLCKLAARLTAMSSIALKGNAFHFHEKLFAVKPHLGQQQVAAWINSDLEHEDMPRNSSRLQDRYSLRCAPHVIGVVQDSLPWFRQMIENEINSANDNPIIDAENECILHGGHFYGGHIATVMDTLKTQIANIADLLDRQMALLVDPKFNQGLPANLSFSTEERACINHGFKAVQIATSAWTAEALKNTMPASVFSRSTECHNQDKVSMGTISARDCLRIIELTEQVTAAHLLVTTQAIAIRLNKHEFNNSHLSTPIGNMMKEVLMDFKLLTEDRPLDADLRHFLKYIREQKWELYQ